MLVEIKKQKCFAWPCLVGKRTKSPNPAQGTKFWPAFFSAMARDRSSGIATGLAIDKVLQLE